MNLALLDPFRRQIPDRVDSTLSLPSNFHPRRPRGGGGKRNPNNHNPNDIPDDTTHKNHHHYKSKKKTKIVVDHVDSNATVTTQNNLTKKKKRKGNKSEETPTPPTKSTTTTNNNNSKTTISKIERKKKKSKKEDTPKSSSIDDVSTTNNNNIEETTVVKNPSSTKKKNSMEEEEEEDDDETYTIASTYEDEDDGGGCRVVKFNRRGTFVVVGHGSGAVSIHDFASRTLSSLIHPPYGHKHMHASTSFTRYTISQQQQQQQQQFTEKFHKISNAAIPIHYPTTTNTRNNHHMAVTNGTWSRKSRRLLLASYGDVHLRLIDNTHPFGTMDSMINNNNNNSSIHHHSNNNISSNHKSNMECAYDDNTTGTSKKKARLQSNNNNNNNSSKNNISTNHNDPANSYPSFVHTSTNYGTVCPLLRNTQLSSTTTNTNNHTTAIKADDDDYDSDKEQHSNRNNNFTLMRARLIPDVIILEHTTEDDDDDDDKEYDNHNDYNNNNNNDKNDSHMDQDETDAPIKTKESYSKLIAQTIAKVQSSTNRDLSNNGNATDPSQTTKAIPTFTKSSSISIINNKDKDGDNINPNNEKEESENDDEISPSSSIITISSTKQNNEKNEPLIITKTDNISSSPKKTMIDATTTNDNTKKQIKKKKKKKKVANNDNNGYNHPTNTGKTSKRNKYDSINTNNSSLAPPTPRRYQTLVMALPSPVGNAAQIHPMDANTGLVCMLDGSLLIFRFPHKGFIEEVTTSVKQSATTDDMYGDDNTNDGIDNNTNNKNTIGGGTASSGNLDPSRLPEMIRRAEREKVGKVFYLMPPTEKQKGRKTYFVTTASFSKDGDIVYAATKCGHILGFHIPNNYMDYLKNNSYMATLSDKLQPHIEDDEKSNDIFLDKSNLPIVTSAKVIRDGYQQHPLQPTFCITVPGGSNILQIVISRNGQMLLINSSDCALRLYDVQEIQNKIDDNNHKNKNENSDSTFDMSVKPRHIFQDMVSKTPWACCDFSGDSEYVVAGCNLQQPGDHYELNLWNTSTGALIDQLEGPSGISVQSTSWHPTRSFIAVSTSDGLVDIWGPRMDWTAFAPDFQALPRNIEYIEKEDEFDIVMMDDEDQEAEQNKQRQMQNKTEEEEIVDVVTIDKIPVFDSDSENETDVFSFETKVIGLMQSGRRGKIIGSE